MQRSVNVSGLAGFLTTCLVVIAAPIGARAATLTDGNLIVTVNEFTGSTNAPRWIREYTPGGGRIQTFPRVPTPTGSTDPTDTARDLLRGLDGAIYLYNGTFTPTLSRLDVGSSTWTQTPIAGWSTANNGTFGGIDQMGAQLFLSDMNTGGAPEQGIVRLDLATAASDRIALGIGPNDFDIGANGILYALDGRSSPRSTIYRFDPITGASLGTVTVPFLDYRGIAAGPDGSFYLTTSSGLVAHHSATGALIRSLTVAGEFLSDIDLDPRGRIAIGTGGSGNVVITDAALSGFTKFRATDSTTGGSTFVAWVTPVPEPGTALFGAAIMALCCVTRSRRSRRG
jgi:hypothetical protein